MHINFAFEYLQLKFSPHMSNKSEKSGYYSPIFSNISPIIRRAIGYCFIKLICLWIEKNYKLKKMAEKIDVLKSKAEKK